MYKLTSSPTTVHRTTDNAFIPFDGGNRDYQEYLLWLSKGNQPEPYIPPPPPVPQSITRRQCAIELRERSLITPQEALDMTRTGIPPAMIQSIFDAISDGNERIIAETDFAADTYLRSNPLLNQIMTASGATSDDIDDFFRSAAGR
jgi:hypothetical protein